MWNCTTAPDAPARDAAQRGFTNTQFFTANPTPVYTVVSVGEWNVRRKTEGVVYARSEVSLTRTMAARWQDS